MKAVLALSAFLVSGCLGGSHDAFWFVTVFGGQQESPPPPELAVCDWAPSWAYNETSRTVSYLDFVYDDEPTFDPDDRLIVGFGFMNRTTGCPELYALRSSNGAVEETLGEYGGLRIERSGPDLVRIGGKHQLRPGQSFQDDFTTTGLRDHGEVAIGGTLTVHHHGLWPRSGLSATPPQCWLGAEC